MFESLSPPYDVIVVDPPWAFKSNSKAKPGRNASRYYETMSPTEIAHLPVKALGAEVCLLLLWITGPFLAIGAQGSVMKAWGFEPSAIGFTWVKLKPSNIGLAAASLWFHRDDLHMGQGFTTRKNAEFCLIGKRKRSLRQNAGVHEIIISPRREHSRKPDDFYKRIRAYVGPDARICELFARERRPGIDGWGDELEKFS
jgi:N6-adenosine-specific RNA methylase IME4